MKRFTRSREHNAIAGVCGGLGEYFNLDPVFFRLAMALPAILIPGVAQYLIITYLVLWFATPQETPSTDVIDEDAADQRLNS
jgi:phage shock protein C